MSKETEEEFKKLLFDEIHIQPNTYDIDTKQLCDDVVQELKAQGFFISQWRPIEEAPKDGSIFTAYFANICDDDAEFWCIDGTSIGSGAWCWDGTKFRPFNPMLKGMIVTVQPTHFMPLPPSPEGEE